MDELQEVIAEFLVESEENLDLLDGALVALEEHADADVLAGIFRTVHTIKGTSGFLGLSRLEAITHAGETLLARLRDGALQPSAATTTVLLAMVDAVRDVLADVRELGMERPGDDSDLVRCLEALAAGEPLPEDSPLHAALAPTPAGGPNQDDPAGPEAHSDLAAEHDVSRAVSALVEDDDSRLGTVLLATGAIAPRELDDALRLQAALREQGEATREQGEGSIRVDVHLLDDLMNLVGELVLTRNQILQFGGDVDGQFAATTQRLNLLTSELQEGVMKTRMQPIEQCWSKFPRIVRDLALQCGKKARLVTEGKDTELDKTLLEAIKDPLTHLLRNAVDHGIESPAVRLASGKPEAGTVRLAAYHEGGQVVVEIGDDGAGIDPNLLRRKAVEKGLLSPAEAQRRSDREVLGVIFTAGFSTAATVTSISGRGVGMDVVKTNIEAIGGSVEVHSVVGRGTTFKVRIPLTLAIVPALVVSVGGERYAIPQGSLTELVRLEGPAAASAIEHVYGAPVHRLRGGLLPVVRLHELLGVASAARPESLELVVLDVDGQRFGLVVDEIHDTAEIVVKPLGRLLRDVPAFAGATIMGDGRVALILDVLGLAALGGLAGDADPAAAGGEAEVEESGAHDGRRSALLLVEVDGRPVGLPLDRVARLEEFDARAVEQAGSRHVVQYRGRILPLVDLGATLGRRPSLASERPLRVVVCAVGDRDAGLVVDEIADIVHEVLDLAALSADPGLVGSAVVQGQVVDVVDVDAVLPLDPEARHDLHEVIAA